jgi:hypothetical protein
MLASQAIPRTASSTVHLRLVQPVAAGTASSAAMAAGVLGAGSLPWLGDRVDGGTRTRTRRFAVDLGLPAGSDGSRVVLRKAAYVDLGQPSLGADAVRLPIGWRAASLAPLFPVFAGHLSVEDGAVVLEGEYAPPGGEVGAAVDRALLNIAARRTAVWLLRLVAQALEEGCTAREAR